MTRHGGDEGCPPGEWDGVGRSWLGVQRHQVRRHWIPGHRPQSSRALSQAWAGKVKAALPEAAEDSEGWGPQEGCETPREGPHGCKRTTDGGWRYRTPSPSAP